MFRMNKLDAIFAKNLIAYRGKESQESFAEKLGISMRSLQRYESGKRMPSSEIIEAITTKLGVEITHFFKVDKEMPLDDALKALCRSLGYDVHKTG